MAHPRRTHYRRKNLLHETSYSQFCPKFRCHGNEGRLGKMQLAAFDGPFPKTFYKRKNLAKIPYTTRVIVNFIPNFIAISTGVGRKKCNWQHSMALLRKLSYGRKNLARIFYASRVIANFVPNFVAMATYVNRANMQLAAFDSSSLKIPIYAQKSRKNLSLKQSYSQFCPNFRCQCNWQHSMAHAVFDVSLIACRR